MATKFPPAGFRDTQSFEFALKIWCDELEDFQLAWLAGPPTPSEINTLHARFCWCRQEVPQLEEGHEGEAFEGWTERAVDLIQRFHDSVSEAVIRGSAALQFPEFNDLFDSDAGGRSDRAWRMLRALADCHIFSKINSLAGKSSKAIDACDRPAFSAGNEVQTQLLASDEQLTLIPPRHVSFNGRTEKLYPGDFRFLACVMENEDVDMYDAHAASVQDGGKEFSDNAFHCAKSRINGALKRLGYRHRLKKSKTSQLIEWE